MQIVVSTTHGKDYDALASIVVPNHIEYCRKNGYEYNIHHATFKGESTYSNSYLIYVKEILKYYDIICTIDLDLLFMNFNIKIEDIFPSDKGQQIAQENLGGCTHNAGVVLWRNVPSTYLLLEEIFNRRAHYEKHCMNWQGQICDHIMHKNPVINEMNIVKENVMNSFPINFKDNDFILHTYCFAYTDKIKVLNEYLKRVVK